jgi:hypothetical protein
MIITLVAIIWDYSNINMGRFILNAGFRYEPIIITIIILIVLIKAIRADIFFNYYFMKSLSKV